MPSMNFREIQHRFGHIDAELVRVSSTWSIGSSSAELVVRFYPWWEHPLYLRALERGEPWRFSNYEEGKREMTVAAVCPRVVHLSQRSEVIEWEFSEEHPLLWQHSERATIFANAPFERELFIQNLSRKLSNTSPGDIRSSIDLPETSDAPFGLTLPYQLYKPAIDTLEQLGIPFISPGNPSAPYRAVVLLLDDSDYIIAQDFEVQVPDFVHLDEWFDP